MDYSGPPVEAPVGGIDCPRCGGEWGEETEEIATITEIPPRLKPEVKAYQVKSRTCCNCSHKAHGSHLEVAAEQFGSTTHRIRAGA